DGTVIAYAASRTPNGGDVDLSLFDLRSRETNRLTGSPVRVAVLPAWSPDGRAVAAVVQCCPSDVAMMRPDGSGVRVMGACADSCDEVLGVSWAPDGTKLLLCLSDG